jgi:large subunit ribosomal protein L13
MLQGLHATATRFSSRATPDRGGACWQSPAGVKTEGDPILMPTYTPKPGEVARAWHVIDANDVVLGRLASQAATLLRGKHKPQFAPHTDTGDFVIVVNAEKVAIAANKRGEYRYRHSGYPGGLTRRTVGELLATKPERVVELAVKGMLPKTTLGRKQLKKLKVYAGPEHPHAAQKPMPFQIKQVSQ